MTDFAARRTQMVDTQVRPSDVTKFPVIDAMLAVPREQFVPASLADVAYTGENLHISEGRVLLEPRTFAKMLDALNIGNADLVLDVAAGLGYGAAVMARIAEAVVAVEDNGALASEMQASLSNVAADNVAVLEGPLTEGAAGLGPFDVIVIEGGVQVLPEALLQQLKEGGRIAVLFVDGNLGEVRIGTKIDGTVNWRPVFNAGAPVLDGFTKAPAFEF